MLDMPLSYKLMMLFAIVIPVAILLLFVRGNKEANYIDQAAQEYIAAIKRGYSKRDARAHVRSYIYREFGLSNDLSNHVLKQALLRASIDLAIKEANNDLCAEGK